MHNNSLKKKKQNHYCQVQNEESTDVNRVETSWGALKTTEWKYPPHAAVTFFPTFLHHLFFPTHIGKSTNNQPSFTTEEVLRLLTVSQNLCKNEVRLGERTAPLGPPTCWISLEPFATSSETGEDPRLCQQQTLQQQEDQEHRTDQK